MARDPGAAEAARHEWEVANSQHGYLKMPAELRNRIYEYTILPDNYGIRLSTKYDCSSCRESSKIPALLSVSRLSRADTTPIFYGINVFRSSYSHEYSPITWQLPRFAWFEKTDIESVRCMKKIEMEIYSICYFCYEDDGIPCKPGLRVWLTNESNIACQLEVVTDGMKCDEEWSFRKEVVEEVVNGFRDYEWCKESLEALLHALVDATEEAFK